MRASDIAIGMRVTADGRVGAVTDIDPEDPGHEFRVDWDDSGWAWLGAGDLEPEGDES